jgi:hypothetical protein
VDDQPRDEASPRAGLHEPAAESGEPQADDAGTRAHEGDSARFREASRLCAGTHRDGAQSDYGLPGPWRAHAEHGVVRPQQGALARADDRQPGARSIGCGAHEV